MSASAALAPHRLADRSAVTRHELLEKLLLAEEGKVLNS